MIKKVLVSIICVFCSTLSVVAEDCKELVNNGKLDKALTCYYKQEESSIKQANIGTVYTLLKEYDLALKFFENAYKMDSENPAIKYSYGVALINASKGNPVIEYAMNNQDETSEFTYISKVHKVNVFSKYKNKDVFAQLINTNY